MREEQASWEHRAQPVKRRRKAQQLGQPKGR